MIDLVDLLQAYSNLLLGEAQRRAAAEQRVAELEAQLAALLAPKEPS